MITIVDYGMGNLGSVLNMFKRVRAEAKIASTADEIRVASKILLPGVGAFDTAMKRINESGLREALDHKALVEKVPILGICLGMQLLTNASEEGALPGLGWIKGRAYNFRGRIENELKVPHMGWNVARPVKDSSLTKNFEGEVRFYFVHSFYVLVEDQQNAVLKTRYGVDFDSAIEKGNIFGAQFHPEKSHKFGMNLLSNFANI